MKKLILILSVFLFGCCVAVEQKQNSVIKRITVQFKIGRAEGGLVCSDGYKFLVINDTRRGGVTAVQVRDEDGKFIKCHDY